MMMFTGPQDVPQDLCSSNRQLTSGDRTQCTRSRRSARCSNSRNGEEAPHCVTCYCLPSECSFRQSQRVRGYSARGLKGSSMGLNYRPQLLGDSRLDSAGDQSRAEATSSPKRSSRRRPRRTATVDELLREMKLRHGGVLSDNEIEAIERTGQANAAQARVDPEEAPASNKSPEVRTREGPESGAAGDCGFAETSCGRTRLRSAPSDRSNATMKDRSSQRDCELWSATDSAVAGDRKLGSLRQTDPALMVPTIEGLGSDNSARDQGCGTRNDNHTGRHQSPSARETRASYEKWRLSGRRNSALLCAGDSATNKVQVNSTMVRGDGEGEEEEELELDETEMVDDEEDDGCDASASAAELEREANVRELKLVRWGFIERIYDEVQKLHRLQRHLDGCSPRRSVTHTRSVSTMTTASRRRRRSESDVDLARDS